MIGMLPMMDVARYSFYNDVWAPDYGGPKWGKGVDVWMNLITAHSPKELYLAIDAVFDLQHNNGVLLNKSGEYDSFFIQPGVLFKLNSYHEYKYRNKKIDNAWWLRGVLDIKSKVDPWVFWPVCSPIGRSVFPKLMHLKGYGSLEIKMNQIEDFWTK